MKRASCHVMRLAGVAQLVEHNVANVVVDGSNPFTRSLSQNASCLFSFRGRVLRFFELFLRT